MPATVAMLQNPDFRPLPGHGRDRWLVWHKQIWARPSTLQQKKSSRPGQNEVWERQHTAIRIHWASCQNVGLLSRLWSKVLQESEGNTSKKRANLERFRLVLHNHQMLPPITPPPPLRISANFGQIAIKSVQTKHQRSARVLLTTSAT